MDINLPVGDYYPKNNSKFVDPMFVPYQRKALLIDGSTYNPHGENAEQCYLSINTWKKTFNPNYVHPDRIRRGWNWDYLNIEPGDPCPGGFRKDPNRNDLCVRIKEEAHDSSFYSKDMFAVKHQYKNGYTVNLNDDKLEIERVNRYDNGPPTFVNGSVNPYTGQWVVYNDPKNNGKYNKYGGLPSRNSYLGI